MTDPYDQLGKTVEDAVKKAMKEEMQAFYIDRETHYQDHKFIREVRLFFQGFRSSAISTVVRVLIPGLIGVFIYGIIYLLKKHLN